MTEYPLITPPNCAGVYALKNKQTGQLYVGETLQLAYRYGEWRMAFRGTAPARSARMRSVFGETSGSDWSFVVLAKMPGATKAELRAAEQKAIDRIMERDPTRVLNAYGKQKQERREGDTRLTRITYQGRELTYREASEILGITRIAIKTKVAKLRAKGVNDVTIEQLAKKSR